MLPNPEKINKYLYIEKSPTWKIRSLYLLGILSWLLIMQSYWSAIGIDPFFTFFVTPLFILLSIYHLASFGLNLFYKQFDLKRHLQMARDYKGEPSVDIFLPVCGEETEVLQNTWEHVSKLNYKNKTVYVLDDSKQDTDMHRVLAEQYGFIYMERPDKGRMKKAGNLKYTFERSSSDFIAIFDADFAPHPDFIRETLPYMDNPRVGIVQTPQYFEQTKEFHKESPFSYNAAFAEEPFYRFIQVTRNRFGGAICCGSCALYRRSAIEAIGGPYQIEYSEDAHTGYAITKLGYRVMYVPVLLSIGLSPSNLYSFFHQQHRWCMGSIRLMLSPFFWKANVSWKTKFCYIAGFMFYLHHPITILFSFNLFWTLFLYNESIPQGVSISFYPHMAFAVIYTWIFPIAKLRWGYFELIMARTYAYSHAVITGLLRKSVGWVSTNAKHKTVSQAYSQTTKFVKLYIAVYLILILIGVRTGYLQLFSPDYWSIQFWIFWNLFLTYLVLIKMLQTNKSMTDSYSVLTKLLVRFLPTGKAISLNRKFAYAPFRYIIYIVVFALLVLGFSLGNYSKSVRNLSAQEPVAQVPASTAPVNPTAAPMPSPIASPSAILSPTVTPVAKDKKEATDSAKIKTVVKSYGGWYWQPQLGRARRWMGTDSAGNDIWTDTGN